MRLFVLSAAAAALMAGQAAAETFNTNSVVVEDAAANIEIIPEDRSTIDVVVQAGGRVRAPSVRMDGDHVRIDGGLQLNGCRSNGTTTRVNVRGVGWVNQTDLPRITIRTPRTLNVSMGGATFARVGASRGGAVSMTGCGDADVAAVTGDLRAALTGSGDIEVQEVSGALSAALTGSGDLSVTRAGGDATLRLSGSGDLRVGPVGGNLDGRLTGSGDLAAGDLGGGADLTLTGSGDVRVGAVRGALTAQLTGSGDVVARSVDGPSASLRSNSSGDITVQGGRVVRLNVRAGGSGGVRFLGAAESSEVEVRGSGDVTVADAGRLESLVDSGSGSIRIVGR